MKKIKNILSIAALLTLSSIAANAQKGKLSLGLNYNYSTPLDRFKSDIISNSSPRGFNGDITYSFTDKWYAGLFFGYQDYYQKYPRAVYNIDKNQVVSAVLTNSIQSSPVLVKAKFSPLSNSTSFIQPYLSLGAGANLINYNQYLGQFSSNTSNISFMAQTGAGINIPFGKLSSSGINLGATYNYVPYKKNGYNNLNTVDLQVGVHFPIK
jgi:hypothetical protein